MFKTKSRTLCKKSTVCTHLWLVAVLVDQQEGALPLQLLQDGRVVGEQLHTDAQLQQQQQQRWEGAVGQHAYAEALGEVAVLGGCWGAGSCKLEGQARVEATAARQRAEQES